MTDLYKRLVGEHKRQATEIIKLETTFASGWWVSLDPGSNSCGYALWYGYDLKQSGSLKAKGTIGPRLESLHNQLAAIVGNPVIAVTEKVRTSTGHHFLTWSNGALIAATGAPTVLEVTSGAWQKNTDKTYVKGDERDAIEIGNFCVTLLKESKQIKRKKRR